LKGERMKHIKKTLNFGFLMTLVLRECSYMLRHPIILLDNPNRASNHEHFNDSLVVQAQSKFNSHTAVKKVRVFRNNSMKCCVN
jgi:hypothetical protein